jgi:hypothetical protein
MSDPYDNGYDSAMEDLSSELNKQKRKVSIYKIAFLAALAVGTIIITQQFFIKRKKNAKYDLDKNTESK